jgi:UDPglucose 6-dehydrogenase
MLSVGVIGAGYVGLVTGACLAELGHRVVCVDVDADKVARLKAGNVPIYEPGLAPLIAANVEKGRLDFASRFEAAAKVGLDVVLIAVGTPTETGGNGANLEFVFAAVEDAARALAICAPREAKFTVIATKSTVPVGANRRIAAIAGRHLAAERFAVASNPEFLREGSAIADFMRPDRIVIGSESARARRLLTELYLPLTRQGRPLVATAAVETAELIKYAANAFLATKVTFVNELARLCEAAGADIGELTRALGLDSRIGERFLSPGPGFGGSCFPKDLLALVKTGDELGSPVEIIQTVIRANERHKLAMVDKIRAALGGVLNDRRIAVLGLAFKANTDDMRDSPSLTIVGELMAAGANLSGYDPAAMRQAAELLPSLPLAASAEAALIGAEAAVILTEWDDFRQISWEKAAALMRRPLVVDLRNMFSADDMTAAGVEYLPLGRRDPQSAYRAAAE